MNKPENTIECIVLTGTSQNITYGVDSEPNPRTGIYELVRFDFDPFTKTVGKHRLCAAFIDKESAEEFIEWLQNIVKE